MILVFQVVGDVAAEGGVAAVVGHDHRAVEDDIGRGGFEVAGSGDPSLRSG
jgi:hypothetical protein